MKPRLSVRPWFRFVADGMPTWKSVWICHLGQSYGFGMTPEEAYKTWKANSQQTGAQRNSRVSRALQVLMGR